MKTREDVVAAIENLVNDLERAHDTWENPTLERYLSAMAAWLNSWGNKNNPEVSWDIVVMMLEAGKTYE